MIESLLNILPIALLFLLGISLRVFSIISQNTISEIKKIVANIALPALLFTSFMEVDFEPDFLVIILFMFLFPVIMLLIGGLINRISGVNSKYFRFLMAGYETGMLGYAIFLTFFGTESLPAVAIVDLGQGLFVFFVLLPTLNVLEKGAFSIKDVLLSIVSSPVIIAIVLGLLLGSQDVVLTSTSVGSSISQFISLLSGLTTPLIVICLGYELQFSKNGFTMALKTVVIRKSLLFISAIIFNHFVIINILHLPEIYSYALYTVMLMPPPFVISIFMDQEDRKSVGYITNTVSISILVSVAFLLFILI